jgi:hypothetical protein
VPDNNTIPNVAGAERQEAILPFGKDGFLNTIDSIRLKSRKVFYWSPDEQILNPGGGCLGHLLMEGLGIGGFGRSTK